MYKKRSSLCLIVSIVFNGYAMDNSYESIPASDKVSSLPVALKNLDEAYKSKEKKSFFDNIDLIKKDIKKHKNTYYKLIKKSKTNLIEVTSGDDGWHNMEGLNLSNKGLKTTLLTLPNYVNPIIIRYINFMNNNLKDLPLSLLAKTMPNLEELHVDHNNISYISTHGKALLNKLSQLSISHNKLTEIDLEALIEKYPALKIVNLSDNPLVSLLLHDKSSSCSLDEKFAIDVRNTHLTQNDIALLKRYCLMGIHNSIKNRITAGGIAASFVGSIGCTVILTLLSPLFVQQSSLGFGIAGGIPLATVITGIIGYINYKKQTDGSPEFYNIRFTQEQSAEDESIVVDDDKN